VFDFNNLNNLDPHKGCLLLAEPMMMDSTFRRSVVLLCELNDDGALGFVLNRSLDLELNEIVEDFPTFDGTVGIGGPVQKDNLFFIHTIDHLIGSSFDVGNGLYMGGNLEDLKTHMLTGLANKENIRFFVGYTGWANEQLEAEMKENSWLVAKGGLIDPLISTETDLWESVLEKMGKKYEILKNFPEDPSLN